MAEAVVIEKHAEYTVELSGMDDHPVRDAGGSCVCGKPIQPGQLFVPGRGRARPRHLGCGQIVGRGR